MVQVTTTTFNGFNIQRIISWALGTITYAAFSIHVITYLVPVDTWNTLPYTPATTPGIKAGLRTTHGVIIDEWFAGFRSITSYM